MLAVLLAGQFMALLDVTIVNVAMPTIGRTLHASGTELQLIVSGYTVSYAMLLITGARLGDLRGRRNLFVAGVAVFTLASAVCGFAPNAGVLIAARFVQGKTLGEGFERYQALAPAMMQSALNLLHSPADASLSDVVITGEI